MTADIRPADEGDVDGFVVIVHGRDFLDVLQDFVEEVARFIRLTAETPMGSPRPRL